MKKLASLFTINEFVHIYAYFQCLHYTLHFDYNLLRLVPAVKRLLFLKNSR